MLANPESRGGGRMRNAMEQIDVISLEDLEIDSTDPLPPFEQCLEDSTPAADQDVVDNIGKAAGVTYAEGEPLRVGAKETLRDVHRWELDPASSEDYDEREHPLPDAAEKVMRMQHVHRARRPA